MGGLVKRSLMILLLAICAAPSGAEHVSGYHRYLVPILIDGEVSGGYGSRWRSELVGRNEMDRFVRVVQNTGTCHITCPKENADPRSTFSMEWDTFPRQGAGAFIHVADVLNLKMSLNLRIQDVSRQALTWGTEIPIVHEREARTDEIQLVNVPSDARFRVALRVYDFAPRWDVTTQVRVRFFSRDGVTVIAERVLNLPGPFEDQSLPGYGEILDVTGEFPQLQGTTTFRIEISPITAGLEYWAFVAVTNNETQHVTTITPQTIAPR